MRKKIMRLLVGMPDFSSKTPGSQTNGYFFINNNEKGTDGYPFFPEPSFNFDRLMVQKFKRRIENSMSIFLNIFVFHGRVNNSR